MTEETPLPADAVPAPLAEQVAEALPAPAETPAPPAAPPHDPYLVAQAKELGIPETLIAESGPAELQRSVYLLNQQQTKLLRELRQNPQPQAPAAPAPDPDFGLPAEIKQKLAEFDPSIAEAIEFTGKAGFDRARRAEAQLAEVRQHQDRQAFAMQVRSEMDKIPEARRGLVLSKIVELEQSGSLPPGTPPSVAVPLAHKELLKAFGLDQPAAVARPAVAATPTAKPSSRLADQTPDLSALSIREHALQLARAEYERWESERARSHETNGKFVP